MNKAKLQTGFTLIELLVVIAIIALLAAVAVPSYQDSVRKSRRTVAKAELLELLGRQEQYFINNKAYATTLGALGYDVDGSDNYFVNAQGENSTSSTGTFYRMAISGASAIAFTLQAAPINDQTKDTLCGTMSITNTSTKGKTGTGTVAQCW